jgi:twitching motility protein PilT
MQSAGLRRFEFMAATGSAPISIFLEASAYSRTDDTHTLLAAILRAHSQVSDLIFSPGRLPQVIIHGQLITVEGGGLHPMNADDTRRIAADVIGNNKPAITLLREQGFCDVSFSLSGCARFRINTFIQRGSCAVVMRVIPTSVPTFASLGLPHQLEETAALTDGLVMVTGSRGCGKSSTLAALLDRINETRTCHIITIEDPIEFLHNHKRATVHQRELHSDTPSMTLGLRAALRQSPDVILVGEMHDRETIEMALEAAETGHLVLSGLNTLDAAQTMERLVNAFSVPEQGTLRNRLARTFRLIVSQKLVPRKDNAGRVPVFEILKVQGRTMACLDTHHGSGEGLRSLIKQESRNGMQHFDGEIEKLVRAGVLDIETAVNHATDPKELRQALVY